MRSSRTRKKANVRPLMDWYQRTTGSFVDKMCCSSYSSQVYDEEEVVDYGALRAKMVVPDWIQEYDDENSTPEERHHGHISLQDNANDCSKGNLCLSSHKSDRSTTTATTVSTSTVRTSRSIATATTLNTSNRTGRSSDPSIEPTIVDDIVYVRSGSLDERKSSSSRAPREIDVTRYRRQRSDVTDTPRLRTVPSDALPGMPYLTLTEGYRC
jgi:hypothetical protein